MLDNSIVPLKGVNYLGGSNPAKEKLLVDEFGQKAPMANSILEDKMLNPRPTKIRPFFQEKETKCDPQVQSLLRNCTNNPDRLCKDDGTWVIYIIYHIILHILHKVCYVSSIDFVDNSNS